MNLIMKLKSLVYPSSADRRGIVVPEKRAISRRTFFSFFGAGVAMVTAPGLFVSPIKNLIVPAGKVIELVPSNMLEVGLRAEFARTYAKIYREQLSKTQFVTMMDGCSNIAKPMVEKKRTISTAFTAVRSSPNCGFRITGRPNE